MDTTSHLLRARWIVPIAEPPIEDGLIQIDDGTITRLGSGADAEAVDLGNVAILPGLVNAHTHLEFSDITQPLGPSSPFAEWVRSVIQHRRNMSDTPAALQRGVDEVCDSGTSLIGEIATSTRSPQALQTSRMPAVVFREVLGLDESAIERNAEALAGHFEACDGPQLQPGISPHAPYSVPPELLRWAIDLAVDRELPVAMHVAETREELQLLRDGTGPLVEQFRTMGIWREGVIPPGTAIDDILATLVQAPRVLIVHGNYLTTPQIAFLAAQPHVSVVYCPRTHAYFGHPDHPWQQMRERGINVALGTDSRASNPDLSLWNEIRFLRQHVPQVPAAILLELATRNGAVALGREDSAGTLQPGRAADLLVVELADGNGGTDAEEQLLHPASRLLRTMRHGRWQ